LKISNRIYTRVQAIYEHGTDAFECLITPIIGQIPRGQTAPINRRLTTEPNAVLAVSLAVSGERSDRNISEADSSVLHDLHWDNTAAAINCEEAHADFQFTWARRIRAFAHPTVTEN
jgi:hypothetical protein